MSDCSVNDGSVETRLPDGRSIFDLITSNNLNAIRSLLTPLTLRERQTIVYQKIEHKTLLYHACERGFKDIAKYLLDECGADIDDGYCDGSESELPSRIAIKKLDVFLLLLLLRRGAALNNNRKISSASLYGIHGDSSVIYPVGLLSSNSYHVL
ncbi:unnamed protein product [Acanthosepion pharaonis]|uniref:Uncharacterized protein n=1 Tax=Acanthosepion pharaonis TaxID=158019 RepID=A0A812EHD8_ACAPH|nr:unnamed protein product [Sepia pharaonis]